MGFPRQEYWSGGPEPASLMSPALQADALLLSQQGSPVLAINNLLYQFHVHLKILIYLFDRIVS